MTTMSMVTMVTMAMNLAQLNRIIDSYSLAASTSFLFTTSLLSFCQCHSGLMTRKEILNLLKLVFLFDASVPV